MLLFFVNEEFSKFKGEMGILIYRNNDLVYKITFFNCEFGKMDICMYFEHVV